MPLYEYHCTSCDHKFDQYQKVDERDKPTKEGCPECKKLTVEKMLARVSGIVDPITVGNLRTSHEFNDRVKEIKKKNPLHNISDKFLR